MDASFVEKLKEKAKEEFAKPPQPDMAYPQTAEQARAFIRAGYHITVHPSVYDELKASGDV